MDESLPAFQRHAIKFLRDHWYVVEPLTAGPENATLFLARARFPSVVVLVTNGQDRELLDRALDVLRAKGTETSLPTLHLHSTANELGLSDGIQMTWNP